MAKENKFNFNKAEGAQPSANTEAVQVVETPVAEPTPAPVEAKAPVEVADSAPTAEEVAIDKFPIIPDGPEVVKTTPTLMEKLDTMQGRADYKKEQDFVLVEALMDGFDSMTRSRISVGQQFLVRKGEVSKRWMKVLAQE